MPPPTLAKACPFPTHCSLSTVPPPPPPRPLDQHTLPSLCACQDLLLVSARGFSFLFARKLHLIVDGCKPNPLYYVYVCAQFCVCVCVSVLSEAQGSEIIG